MKNMGGRDKALFAELRPRHQGGKVEGDVILTSVTTRGIHLLFTQRSMAMAAQGNQNFSD